MRTAAEKKLGHVEKVDAMTEHQLIKNLTKGGFLTDWTKQFCPHSEKYSVGELQKRSEVQTPGTWCYRCNANGCQKFILPHVSHVVLNDGWGRSHKSLASQ
eukprot:9458523-Pyramimonas_sp.AAC.1